MDPGLLGLPWVVWAVVAFAVAAIFTFVTPRSVGASGLGYFVLRWFHAFVWVLLGLSALVRGFVSNGVQAADLVAQLGLVVYLVYLVTFVRAGRCQG